MAGRYRDCTGPLRIAAAPELGRGVVARYFAGRSALAVAEQWALANGGGTPCQTSPGYVCPPEGIWRVTRVEQQAAAP